MTNIDTPIGLRPIEGQDLMARKYSVAAANTTAIFKNDPMQLLTGGTVIPNGTDSDDYCGPALNIYDADGKEISYLADLTAGFVEVATNPNLIMQIQSGDDATELTVAAIGDAADFVATGGNTGLGQSRYELSETLVGNGNAAQMRILDIVKSPNNNWGEHHINLVVQALEHAFNSTPNAI